MGDLRMGNVRVLTGLVVALIGTAVIGLGLTIGATATEIDLLVVPLHNESAEVSDDCSPDNQPAWHFVIAPGNGQYAFHTISLNLADTLFTFTSGDMTWNGGQRDNVFIRVPEGYSVDDLQRDGSFAEVVPASTEHSTKFKFVLSHICPGGSGTTTTTTTTTTTIPATTTTMPGATTTTPSTTTTTTPGTTTTTPDTTTTTTPDPTTTTPGMTTTTTTTPGTTTTTTTTTPETTTTSLDTTSTTSPDTTTSTSTPDTTSTTIVDQRTPTSTTVAITTTSTATSTTTTTTINATTTTLSTSIAISGSSGTPGLILLGTVFLLVGCGLVLNARANQAED